MSIAERNKRQQEELEEAIAKGTVEKKILPLVEALWQLGVPTISSCEGHIDREIPHPQVSVGFWSSTPEGNLKKLILLLGEWNVHSAKEKRVSWVFLPGHVPPSRTSPEGEVWFILEPQEKNLQRKPRVLKRLQNEAGKLAKFLQNHSGGDSL